MTRTRTRTMADKERTADSGRPLRRKESRQVGGDCTECWRPPPRPPQAIYAPDACQTRHAQRAARPSCSVLRGLVSGLGTASVQALGLCHAMQCEQERSPERSDASLACVRVLPTLFLGCAHASRRVALRLATSSCLLHPVGWGCRLLRGCRHRGNWEAPCCIQSDIASHLPGSSRYRTATCTLPRRKYPH